MQQKKVVDWLAQHNFPHGMVSFMDGLSADPLRQKMIFLRTLVNDVSVRIECSLHLMLVQFRDFSCLVISAYQQRWLILLVKKCPSIRPSVRPQSNRHNPIDGIGRGLQAILNDMILNVLRVRHQGHGPVKVAKRPATCSDLTWSYFRQRFQSLSPPPFVLISWVLLLIIIIWDNI